MEQRYDLSGSLLHWYDFTINGSYHGERINDPQNLDFRDHAATDKSGSGKAVF